MFRTKALQAIIFYYSVHNFLFIFLESIFSWLSQFLFAQACLSARAFSLEFFMMGEKLLERKNDTWKIGSKKKFSIKKEIIQWIIYFFFFAFILFYYSWTGIFAEWEKITIRRDCHFDRFLVFTYYATLYSGLFDSPYPLVTKNHTNPHLF
jgi:hypothetical protein